MDANRIIASLKQAGLLTDDQIAKVAARHDANLAEMDKEGFNMTDDLKRALLTAGASTAVGMLGGVAMQAGQDVYGQIREGINRSRDFSAMVQANPGLKDLDQKSVHRSYHIMRKLMPDLASDPIIAGEWVGHLAQRQALGMETLQSMMKAQGEFNRSRPEYDSALARSMQDTFAATNKEVGKSLAQSLMNEKDSPWGP